MIPENELQLRALAGRAMLRVSEDTKDQLHSRPLTQDEMIIGLLAARYALGLAFPHIRLDETEYTPGVVQAEVDRQEALDG
jgi:hypothetical protein